MLTEEEEEMETVHSDDFYMSRYKCLWRPIGVQHGWQQCIYAHSYMDVECSGLPRILLRV